MTTLVDDAEFEQLEAECDGIDAEVVSDPEQEGYTSVPHPDLFLALMSAGFQVKAIRDQGEMDDDAVVYGDPGTAREQAGDDENVFLTWAVNYNRVEQSVPAGFITNDLKPN